MYVTGPYEFIRFGAMDATEPYEFIGFGAMYVTGPHEFIGFGAIGVTRPAHAGKVPVKPSFGRPGALVYPGPGHFAGGDSLRRVITY